MKEATFEDILLLRPWNMVARIQSTEVHNSSELKFLGRLGHRSHANSYPLHKFLLGHENTVPKFRKHSLFSILLQLQMRLMHH